MVSASGSGTRLRRAAGIAPLLVTLAPLVVLVVLMAGCATYRGARLYVSGSRALERGEIERAIEDLERAARLVPQSSEVQNHLGLAYRALGRSDRARSAFARALSLDCANSAARQNLSALIRGERSHASRPLHGDEGSPKDADSGDPVERW